MKTLPAFVITLFLTTLSPTVGALGILPPTPSPEYYGNWTFHSEQYSPYNFWSKICVFQRIISPTPTNNDHRLGSHRSNNQRSLGLASRVEYRSITVSRAFNCLNARP